MDANAVCNLYAIFTEFQENRDEALQKFDEYSRKEMEARKQKKQQEEEEKKLSMDLIEAAQIKHLKAIGGSMRSKGRSSGSMDGSEEGMKKPHRKFSPSKFGVISKDDAHIPVKKEVKKGSAIIKMGSSLPKKGTTFDMRKKG